MWDLLGWDMRDDSVRALSKCGSGATLTLAPLLSTPAADLKFTKMKVQSLLIIATRAAWRGLPGGVTHTPPAAREDILHAPELFTTLSWGEQVVLNTI